MEIDEARRLMGETEQKIDDLLREFTDKTGLNIDYVDISDRWYRAKDRSVMRYSVKLGTRLTRIDMSRSGEWGGTS